MVLYIDAAFVHTRRDKSVSKEVYYTILGIKEDDTREVLSVVNHPTEAATLWQMELDSLKERGVQSVGLIVSDGLTSIEKAIVKNLFICTTSTLCSTYKTKYFVCPSKNKREEIAKELLKIFVIETKKVTPVEGFKNLWKFVERCQKSYPILNLF